MTPHIEAAAGDYAQAVLLPGDPQRAAWIAETFLADARCVNRIRGELGFTGRLSRQAGQHPGDGHGPVVGLHLPARARDRLRRVDGDPHRHLWRAA